MMFLLKITFWIMLIFLLLPGSQEDNRKLVTSAGKTVEDFGGFCTRNPDVCANVRSAATSLASRVKNGAELMKVWFSTKEPNGREFETLSAPEVRRDEGRQEPSKMLDRFDTRSPQSPRTTLQWNNSLNPGDRQFPWRGPTGS